MWKNVAYRLLGPIAHAWVRAIVRRDAELAAPTGSPISHGSGPDPVRVLVLGSPVVQGIGVASFDLSFSGHLARRLAARTGRGADVEARGIDRFDALIAADVMHEENLARFDLVLVLGGVTEIVSLMPMSRYRRNMQTLLDTIERDAPPHLPVLIAGVAPFMQDMDAPNLASTWMSDRIGRQNAVTREVCEQSGAAEYVTFAPERAGIRLGRDSSAVYESWVTALLPAVASAVSRQRVRQPVVLDEVARQRALDDLGVLDTAPNAAVDRIVEMARDMLGADAASLNFIDHDRQWSKASSGIALDELPRDEAICNTTIQNPGVYVIEDVDEDPDFRDSTWTAEADHVRFYAGYPVESPTGERVGALCVMARSPRRFSRDETATLRDLALRAQAVLWEQAG